MISVFIAGDADIKAMQGIANDRLEIAKIVFKNREKSIGRKDSNLRPSAPKALELIFMFGSNYFF